MARLTQLDDVIFPVEEHPVFVSVKTESGEHRLSVPAKKAIINSKSNRVLGVVSSGYRLVTNQQVLDWAYQCCRTVFPETKPQEWKVGATDAPETGGHCFIDLVHNSTVLDFSVVPAKDRPDNFGPFIRVTNSYNGLGHWPLTSASFGRSAPTAWLLRRRSSISSLPTCDGILARRCVLSRP